MRVLVTGAGGFTGRTVASRLRARGDEVLGPDVRAVPELGVTAGDVSTPRGRARGRCCRSR